MIWIKPEWANQIPDGVYDIRVGDSDGFIRCDSYLEYFMAEGAYQMSRKLCNTKMVNLSVFTLDSNGSARIDIESQRKQVFGDLDTSDESFILDIDLDFFSTDNPFKRMFDRCGTYELLKPIFRGDFFERSFDKGTEEEELLAFAVQRSHYIDCLEDIFNQLAQNVGVDKLVFAECLHSVKQRILTLITHIIRTNNDSAISWKTFFDAGCTFDSNELPTHVSSPHELSELMTLFKRCLRQLNTDPVLVTISRSSNDGYCPAEQVDGIQQAVLDALADTYGDKLTDKPILQYKNENWCL